MSIISQIRVLKETYIATKKETYDPTVTFKLPENRLPYNHTIDLFDNDVVVIQGNIGCGKTTFLKNIKKSIDSNQHYLRTGVSIHTTKYSNFSSDSANKPILFTEWQRINDAELFLDFANSEFIKTNYDAFLRNIPFNDNREKQLIARIMRNSSDNKGSKKEISYKLESLGFTMLNMDYPEFLEKYCLFVETGVNLIHSDAPEAVFGNYELKYHKNIDPAKIVSSYVDFYAPHSGMSQGQSTLARLNLAKENSKDLSLTLLDEPTNSLPDAMIPDIVHIIEGIKGQKILVTHNNLLANSFAKQTHLSFYNNPVSSRDKKYKEEHKASIFKRI